MLGKFRAASFGVLLVFSLVRLAHAAPRFADYPSRKASECAARADELGLVVGVLPVDDLNDQKSYFGSDLTHRGFLPVYLVLENQSNGDAFLFDKSAVKVGVGAASGSSPDMSSKSVETLQVASAIAISPIGLIIGAKLAKDEAAIQANLVKKEVRSRTISSGASTSGFLYIPVPKNAPRQPVHLQVTITRSGDDNPFVLDFNF
jgi:hypothetical protein